MLFVFVSMQCWLICDKIDKYKQANKDCYDLIFHVDAIEPDHIIQVFRVTTNESGCTS